MQTITQFNMSPEDVKTMLFDVLKQATGTHPAGTPAVRTDDVPPQSGTQAADYLGCSVRHLETLVRRYAVPNQDGFQFKPINEEKKAVRYSFAQLHYLKTNNLVK